MNRKVRPTAPLTSAPRTFQEASAEIQANLQKHLAKQKSLREDADSEESSDDDEMDLRVPEEVLDKVFRSYGADPDVRTSQAVLEVFRSGHSSCLICISSIKKQDAIWSCQACFCSFHVSCIQRWGKDCIFQQKNELENDGSAYDNRTFQWGCPKCRNAYKVEQIPTKYTCFCGKLCDPPFDPWVVPHSCGEKCGKLLSRNCGHHCLLLCHPGPCPPCPQMVTTPCYCGNAAPATRRCYDKAWSCGRRCNHILNCGQHPCPQNCHAATPCPPCQKTSVQLCLCQRQQKQCQCSTPKWQCQEKCARSLKCGHHICDIVCHEGSCPPCPLSELRHCPCGKSTYKLECTVATPTCGDTCGRTLSCGAHVCAERCHRGPCGSCLHMEVKKCKCGNKQKEILCTRSFTCDLKCKRTRDCRRHACNRKCCDGTCPPCEQTCNKPLSCKNHKCVSRCHQGACYPCNQTKEVSCNCGTNRILVPCGREKTTKPPKCKQPCRNPPNCHHLIQQPHPCHFGPCPPCHQPCGQSMKCGHSCPVSCHDQVKVLNSGVRAAVPWEEVSPRMEVKTLDCPDCKHPVPVTCLGGHETADWPCFAAKVASCGRKCGRDLPCGNHKCGRDCHRVKHAESDSVCGSNCRKCELGCQRSRPEGCGHPCSRPCHADPCEPCKQMVRIQCHCSLSQLYVNCGEWTLAATSEDEKNKLACCQNQCPKIIACSHRCSKVCHVGECSEVSSCKKKTKMYCPCKRRKEDRPCGKLSLEVENVKIQCNDECEKLKLVALVEKDDEERKRKEEEARMQKEELERFDKKTDGKRRRRNRQRLSENSEENLFKRYKLPIIVALVAAVLASVFVAMKKDFIP